MDSRSATTDQPASIARLPMTALHFKALLLITALLAFATPANAGKFDATAYLDFKQATATAISPDGKQIAFTVNVFDPGTDLQQSELWIVPAAGESPRLLGNGESARWCPGLGLVSLSRTKDQLQLQVSDGASVSRPMLQAIKNVSDFACSPDGRELAVVGSRTAPTEGEASVANSLFLADVETGNLRELVSGISVADPEWSPTGARIAASVDGDIELIGVDGKRTTLVKRPGRDLAPHWSPDGSQIVFATQGGKALGTIGLQLVPAAGGEPRPIAGNFTTWLRGQPPRWVQWTGRRTLLFTGLARMRTHVYAVDLDKPAVASDLTPGDRVFSGCSWSSASRHYACVTSSLLTPPDVVLRGFGSQSERQLTRLNLALDLNGQETIREVQWRSPDGTGVTGLLAMPAHSSGALPLVALNVGSHGTYDHSFTTRVSADDTWFPYINHHLLVAQGYAVLMPNPRGSWGYGEAFQNVVAGDPAVGPFSDIESGVDEMVKEGIADPNRLAIVATGTYDAYRVVYGLTRTSRYRAAVLTIPIVDVVSAFALAPDAFSTRYFGGSPLAEPAKFDAINPIRNAAAIRTPTLIYRVAIPPYDAQADLLAAALKTNKVAVESKPVPGRFIDPPRRSDTKDAIATGLDWLNIYLKSK
jgi:dipeptidyl aminopeptidase/acylaminoacyl peptidase